MMTMNNGLIYSNHSLHPHQTHDLILTSHQTEHSCGYTV